MSNVYSLDDLRSDLDKVYAPLEVDGVVLRNLMRLGKADRQKVMDAFAQTQDADSSTAEGVETLLEGIKTIIQTVAASGGPALVKKIGDDLALAVRVMELWTEATNPGEAVNSPA